MSFAKNQEENLFYIKMISYKIVLEIYLMYLQGKNVHYVGMNLNWVEKKV